MGLMRAKMLVTRVAVGEDTNGNIFRENITFTAVSRNDGYPEDGSDENNTYARWTPCADLTMTIQNPALFGKISEGQEFYVDFTPVE